mmetsp:Transcript_17286/g.42569  ORF Transcript_17286/g.42569 Transcript_17286/m.42569 type:complete len:97 (+) Transcript_17286:184-474(+)
MPPFVVSRLRSGVEGRGDGFKSFFREDDSRGADGGVGSVGDGLWTFFFARGETVLNDFSTKSDCSREGLSPCSRRQRTQLHLITLCNRYSMLRSRI